MFVWENYTGGGCWSGLGQISGYSAGVFSSMTQTGAPAGWQVIAMAENCGGGTAATVHHEVLHALGVGHEHNRPDRNLDKSTFPLPQMSLFSETLIRIHFKEMSILSSIQPLLHQLISTTKSQHLIG